MDLLKEVGAIAGLASFVGLALLCLLYFAQARDVRRLRENASFLVESGAGDGETVTSAERAAAAVGAKEPDKAAAAAAATAPTEAEAFRRAELARQAAERRQRFERRRKGPGRERPAWLSEPSSVAVVVVGAILLIAGVAFGVTRVVGGDDESAPSGGANAKGPCPPSQTKVAVLNGTATAGLAANFAGPLKQEGYKAGPIGNTESPVASSVVMFDPQIGADCGPVISKIVGISKQQPMNAEIQGLAEGDAVAVVLGEDQAGASSTESSATTGSGI
jgi:hypothetical protein